MNIYDFDGTIYNGDSCKDIVLYGLRKYPSLTLKSLKKARILNRDYKSFKLFQEEVKREYKLTPSDRIENMFNTLDVIQKILSTFK